MKDFGFVHLSSGDLLREARKSGTPEANEINRIIAAGEMVPGDTTVNLIKAAMKTSGWTSKKYLIDGFPRT